MSIYSVKWWCFCRVAKQSIYTYMHAYILQTDDNEYAHIYIYIYIYIHIQSEKELD